MTRGRTQEQWLRDILKAIEAIRAAERLQDRLVDLGAADDQVLEDVIADTLTYRVMHIGEAVKHLSPTVTAACPDVPWTRVVRMRDLLSHHYHQRNLAVIRATVDDHLDPLGVAVEQLLTTLAPLVLGAEEPE
ncbi:HepT-like ribonuclease domain-containing protein [Cellulomonas soli]